MTTAISAKLAARVLSSVDLDKLFPNSSLKSLVAFDVEIVTGAISTGKKVWLTSGSAREELLVKGIEMESHPPNQNLVRIHCSKPKKIPIPLSASESWTITAS